jgi:multidrug efflux system membrane fusion protein
VILRGRTETSREVEVRAETSGRVISAPLRKGGSVDEGQLLCELDPGTRRSALAEAEARLAEAQLQFNAAERLSQDGFATETRAASARAALQGAEAAVAAARAELDRLEIHAPFEGLLESDTAELGALLQPGALCATIVQLDPIRLVGFVPEIDVDKVVTGAVAGARLTSGREIAGRVSFVARTADPATRTFRVEVTVPNADLSIRDGQTAEIGISATGTTAHLVPGSALTLDDGGAIGLRIIDADSRALFMPVGIVRDTTEGLWVTGLPDEVDLIVVGQEYVRDGVRVVPTFREIGARAATPPLPGEAAMTEAAE